ncbi:MAG: iron-containing alcohol dehydrogenase [Schwartzia sp.]|nr:iron-containing alcohol dehydrogenase [Schwartzia sp. (in: firmicutes)]
MNSFTFCLPTEIIFGRGAEKETAAAAGRHGGRRVLLVFGGSSAKKSGLLDRIEEGLRAEGILFEEFGGAQPNPTLSHAREGVRRAAKFGADLILAVGGGSVIDTAKAIAHGAANLDIDIWEFWSGVKPVERTLPVGVVLTISAAGSETSDSAVLTNEETGKKAGINTPFNRPAFAVMDPELTYSLPRAQLAAGIADIMMHTLDRYMTKETGNAFTDRVAEALMKNVVRYAKVAMTNHRDYEAMSELMWCGSFSHAGYTSLGRARDFSVHKLGHELSGKYGVTHGESLTTMWPAWARYVYPDAPERFAQYAENVWGVCVGTTEERARAGIRETEEFWHGLGLPLSFRELGIGVLDETALEALADMCTNGGKATVGVFHPMNREEVLAVYRLANH